MQSTMLFSRSFIRDWNFFSILEASRDWEAARPHSTISLCLKYWGEAGSRTHGQVYIYFIKQYYRQLKVLSLNDNLTNLTAGNGTIIQWSLKPPDYSMLSAKNQLGWRSCNQSLSHCKNRMSNIHNLHNGIRCGISQVIQLRQRSDSWRGFPIWKTAVSSSASRDLLQYQCLQHTITIQVCWKWDLLEISNDMFPFDQIKSVVDCVLKHM